MTSLSRGKGTSALLLFPGVGDGTVKAALPLVGGTGTAGIVGLVATDRTREGASDILFRPPSSIASHDIEW